MRSNHSYSGSKISYSHKKEASTNMIGHWTHPDVPMLLQILGCDDCWKHQKYKMRHLGSRWNKIRWNTWIQPLCTLALLHYFQCYSPAMLNYCRYYCAFIIPTSLFYLHFKDLTFLQLCCVLIKWMKPTYSNTNTYNMRSDVLSYLHITQCSSDFDSEGTLIVSDDSVEANDKC